MFLYLIQRKVPNLPEVEKEIVSEIRIIFFHLFYKFNIHSNNKQKFKKIIFLIVVFVFKNIRKYISHFIKFNQKRIMTMI